MYILRNDKKCKKKEKKSAKFFSIWTKKMSKFKIYFQI